MLVTGGVGPAHPAPSPVWHCRVAPERATAPHTPTPSLPSRPRHTTHSPPHCIPPTASPQRPVRQPNRFALSASAGSEQGVYMSPPAHWLIRGGCPTAARSPPLRPRQGRSWGAPGGRLLGGLYELLLPARTWRLVVGGGGGLPSPRTGASLSLVHASRPAEGGGEAKYPPQCGSRPLVVPVCSYRYKVCAQCFGLLVTLVSPPRSECVLGNDHSSIPIKVQTLGHPKMCTAQREQSFTVHLVFECWALIYPDPRCSGRRAAPGHAGFHPWPWD